jgi:hypothetical protein
MQIFNRGLHCNASLVFLPQEHAHTSSYGRAVFLPILSAVHPSEDFCHFLNISTDRYIHVGNVAEANPRKSKMMEA